MKHIARILAVVLLMMNLGSIGYAYEDSQIEVSNGYVEYTVNRNNGRYSIATVSCAAHRNDELRHQSPA